MPTVKIAFMSHFHHHFLVEPNDFSNRVANGNACYFNVLITATKTRSEPIVNGEQRQMSDGIIYVSVGIMDGRSKFPEVAKYRVMIR